MEGLETTLDPPDISSGAAVLCVDDEPQVLRALERTLRREPYEVLRAACGDEALDLLERFPIKVVVSDERMPGMTGSELLSEVRRVLPYAGRIILTSYPGPTLLIRSLEAGGDLLLTKPWNEEKLRRTIRRLISEVDRGGASRGDESTGRWCDLGGEGG